MKPLLAFYGDDFTGSTDVMEVLQWAGLRTVLFLEPPQPEQLAAFDNLRAFGIAGWSRNMSCEEMDAELKPALESLRESGATFVHYKTCSTFDSSPNIGCIGKALEIGRAMCGTNCVPILVASPQLGRYQAFGNLFAKSGLDSAVYRLDRHPTMQHHPITPMHEADIREHLKKQTNLKVSLIDCLQLDKMQLGTQTETLKHKTDAILFDALYDRHMPIVGSLLQSMNQSGTTTFVLGSSGIESALISYWEQTGEIQSHCSHLPERPTFGSAKQLLAITGSCSPVNDRQRSKSVFDNFGKAFVSGNFVEGYPEISEDNWAGGVQPDSKAPVDEILPKIRVLEPFPHVSLKTEDARSAFEVVLQQAGATMPVRDSVDLRIAEMVRTGKVAKTEIAPSSRAKAASVKYAQEWIDEMAEGVRLGYITDPDEVGGYPDYNGQPYVDSDSDGLPDLWERAHGLNPTDASDAMGDLNGDGYLNVEDFINGLDPRVR